MTHAYLSLGCVARVRVKQLISDRFYLVSSFSMQAVLDGSWTPNSNDRQANRVQGIQNKNSVKQQKNLFLITRVIIYTFYSLMISNFRR
mgnify:CR=1 FL=1